MNSNREGAGRTILITGASRGIGAATAALAAAEGYRVAVNYNASEAKAKEVVAGIRDSGGEARAFRADIGCEDDIVRMFDEVTEALGPIDGLVNNAAISDPRCRVDEFGGDDIVRLMAVNVVGTILCCREAVKRMSTKNGGAGGAIINVSSMAGTIGGRPGRTAYAGSKAAIDSFTIGLAREVGAEGIRANTVRPGMTYTDMTDRVRRDEKARAEAEATIGMNRIAMPEEIAAPILWLLSPAASFVSGSRLDASGGGYVIG